MNYSDWLGTRAEGILFFSSIPGPTCPSHDGLWNQGLGNTIRRESCGGGSVWWTILPSFFHWFGGPPVAGWMEALSRSYKTKHQIALHTHKISLLGYIFSNSTISWYFLYSKLMYEEIWVHLFIHPTWILLRLSVWQFVYDPSVG